MEINIVPFVAEAFGQNKRIYNDIDRLYKKKKVEFYLAAKNSTFYDHPAITETDIIMEDYGKKALGIITYIIDHQDETDILRDFEAIIRKGWPRIYSYILNHDTIIFEDAVA